MLCENEKCEVEMGPDDGKIMIVFHEYKTMPRPYVAHCKECAKAIIDDVAF
jgi:hypothetical protein